MSWIRRAWDWLNCSELPPTAQAMLERERKRAELNEAYKTRDFRRVRELTRELTEMAKQ